MRLFHSTIRRWRGLRPGKSNYVVSQSLKHTKLAQDNGGLGVQDSQLFAKAATRNSGHTSRSKVFASKQRLFVAHSVAVVFVDSTTLYQGQVCAHNELAFLSPTSSVFCKQGSCYIIHRPTDNRLCL